MATTEKDLPPSHQQYSVLNSSSFQTTFFTPRSSSTEFYVYQKKVDVMLLEINIDKLADLIDESRKQVEPAKKESSSYWQGVHPPEKVLY